MTLRAWRARGRLLVQCDACSSRGHPAAAVVESVADTKSAEARATAMAAATKLRLEMEGNVRAVMQLHRSGKMPREAAAARVRDLSEKHAASISDIMRSSPGINDGVLEKIKKCPWCDAPGDATVERLSDDASEPPEWLADAKRARA